MHILDGRRGAIGASDHVYLFVAVLVDFVQGRNTTRIEGSSRQLGGIKGKFGILAVALLRTSQTESNGTRRQRHDSSACPSLHSTSSMPDSKCGTMWANVEHSMV